MVEEQAEQDSHRSVMKQERILKQLHRVNGPLARRELARALEIAPIYIASNIGALSRLKKVRMVGGADVNRYEAASPV